jgi:hypothetical protein
MKAVSLHSAMRSSVLVMLLLGGIQGAFGQEKSTTLYKVITIKDDIVIGLSADEFDRLGSKGAGAVASTLAAKGEMTEWQYAVRKASNGDLQIAPLHKICLLANSSLRVEPYSTPLAVIPHE